MFQAGFRVGNRMCFGGERTSVCLTSNPTLAHGGLQRLIRSGSSYPRRLKRMKRIDDEKPGRRPGMMAPLFDPDSILPARRPLKTPDSLQEFSV